MSLAPTSSFESTRIDISSTKKPSRVLIVRLSAMGDVIHTLPAVRALRHAFPTAHIGWMIEERWAALLCAPGALRRGSRSSSRPLVDEVHAVNLKAWGRSLFSISTLQRIATVWNDVRDARYDVAIDLQGAMRSALLARLSRAGVAFGAADPRESPASLGYSRKVVTRGQHVIEHNLSLAEAFVGHRVETPAVELPRDQPAEASVAQRLRDLQIEDYAILNPGAGWGAKRWPAERYGEVARGLRDLGIRSILNYGPGEEDLVKSAETASGGAAQRMKCTISELIALTRRARIFIGGDTGPLHLAAALQIPVVAIFGPTDPARNGPYGTRSVVLRSAQSMTSHARLSHPEEGLLQIQSDAVVSAARNLLQNK